MPSKVKKGFNHLAIISSYFEIGSNKFSTALTLLFSMARPFLYTEYRNFPLNVFIVLTSNICRDDEQLFSPTLVERVIQNLDSVPIREFVSE